VAHALFDQLVPGLDVEGVLGTSRETPDIYTGLHAKMSLLHRRKVDKLTFLFGAQDGPDLEGLGWVLSIDLDGLDLLGTHEGAGCGGHGRVRRRGR
jgi:hypothetical protein